MMSKYDSGINSNKLFNTVDAPPPGLFGYSVQQIEPLLYGCQSSSWSAKGKVVSRVPIRILRVQSHATSSAVPSRVSPLILYTQAEFGAYSWTSLIPPVYAMTII